MSGLRLGLTLAAVCVALATTFAAVPQADEGAARADRTAARLAALEGATEQPSADDELQLLTEAYQSFLDRIEVCDGPRSVRLARAMHARAGAVWSAFCLDGSLRRASPADPGSEAARAAYAEADAALVRRVDGHDPVPVEMVLKSGRRRR